MTLPPELNLKKNISGMKVCYAQSKQSDWLNLFSSQLECLPNEGSMNFLIELGPSHPDSHSCKSTFK